MRRSPIPVRWRIHSSDVSSRPASSSLVTMRAGRYAPQPTICERNIIGARLQCRRLLRSRQLVELRQLVADLFEETVDLEVDRDADRVGEAERVGRAVAFHRNAAEAKEHRPVITAWVEACRQFLQSPAGKDIAEPRQRRMTKRGAQRFAEQLGDAFRGL